MGEIRGKIHNYHGAFFSIWCPACNQAHSFNTERGGWSWDGNWESPTIKGSFGLRDRGGNKPYVCHSIVTAGKINFLTDCQHDKANTTMDLPDFPEDYVKRTFE